MGAIWRVIACAPPGAAPALRGAVQQELDLVIAEMSHWATDSALSRFNAAPAGAVFDLPDGFATVLAAALEIAERTGGAFDPALGACVDLWGFGPAPSTGRPPADDALATALQDSTRRRIDFDPHTHRLVQPGGLKLDLSGVAKGYAVDRVSARLAAEGAVAHFVEIGGDCRAAGTKPDGLPWWVALETALPGARPPPLIALADHAVATSGDRYRRFEHGGALYAHAIDPATGAATAGALAAVTVLAETCMEADALATALLVMGPDRGLAFSAENGVAAFMTARGPAGPKEISSPAFAALLD